MNLLKCLIIILVLGGALFVSYLQYNENKVISLKQAVRNNQAILLNIHTNEVIVGKVYEANNNSNHSNSSHS